MTHEAVITRILRHLKLAAVPPSHCSCPFLPRNVRLGSIRPTSAVGSPLCCPAVVRGLEGEVRVVRWAS